MTKNNNLTPAMTVDEALQYADERSVGVTYYAGRRDLTAVLLVLTTEIRNRREPDQPPFLTFLEMTVDEALQYEVLHTSGATFYDGQRDLDVVLCLVSEEVRRLRKQVNEGFINDECAAKKNERRQEFGEQVKNGRAKATDASMFHGLARESKVKYKNEDFNN